MLFSYRTGVVGVLRRPSFCRRQYKWLLSLSLSFMDTSYLSIYLSIYLSNIGRKREKWIISLFYPATNFLRNEKTLPSYKKERKTSSFIHRHVHGYIKIQLYIYIQTHKHTHSYTQHIWQLIYPYTLRYKHSATSTHIYVYNYIKHKPDGNWWTTVSLSLSLYIYIYIYIRVDRQFLAKFIVWWLHCRETDNHLALLILCLHI